MAEEGARLDEGIETGEGPSDEASISQRKKKTVFPEINARWELSLDGKTEPPSLTAEAQLVSSKESTGEPNISIVAKTLPPEHQVEPPQKPRKPETREPYCILRTSMESFKFPIKFSDADSDDDDGLGQDMRDEQTKISDDLCGIGYLRGLAFSAIHNRDFATASEYLKRELSTLKVYPGDELSKYYKYDVVLSDLECDLYRMECSEIDAKCKDFEEYLLHDINYNSVSLVDLVRWIAELQSIDRHFGSILLCRAVILQLPTNDIKDQTVWYFNLSYFLFVEMCLRTIHLLGKEAAYTDTIKFLFDSMEKSICKMKTSLRDREDSDGSEHMKIKIGVCYLALSYLCNYVKLYESAAKCAEDGLQNQSPHCVLRMDLLINQAVSFLGQGNIAAAKFNIRKAETFLDGSIPKIFHYSKRSPRDKWRDRLFAKVQSEILARGRDSVEGLFDA